jgi:hypothetical protein
LRLRPGSRARGTSSCVGPTDAQARRRAAATAAQNRGLDGIGRGSRALLVLRPSTQQRAVPFGGPMSCLYRCRTGYCRNEKVGKWSVDTVCVFRPTAGVLRAQTTAGQQERKGTTAGQALHICVIRCVRGGVGAVRCLAGGIILLERGRRSPEAADYGRRQITLARTSASGRRNRERAIGQEERMQETSGLESWNRRQVEQSRSKPGQGSKGLGFGWRSADWMERCELRTQRVRIRRRAAGQQNLQQLSALQPDGTDCNWRPRTPPQQPRIARWPPHHFLSQAGSQARRLAGSQAHSASPRPGSQQPAYRTSMELNASVRSGPGWAALRVRNPTLAPSQGPS